MKPGKESGAGAYTEIICLLGLRQIFGHFGAGNELVSNIIMCVS